MFIYKISYSHYKFNTLVKSLMYSYIWRYGVLTVHQMRPLTLLDIQSLRNDLYIKVNEKCTFNQITNLQGLRKTVQYDFCNFIVT
jgi:hypothetical protein